MNEPPLDRLSGHTLRLNWDTGPMKGRSYDHEFREDGTVEFRVAGTPKVIGAERPAYFALDVGPDALLMSYLSRNGFTLSVALNYADGTCVAIASNEKMLSPSTGTFTVVS